MAAVGLLKTQDHFSKINKLIDKSNF
jgi:hypothetical protein